MKPLKIVKLEAENVKRLRAVEIQPDPNDPLVIIRGDNNNGKTSVLDSISYALGGKDVHPPKVIREGEEHAAVVLDLGELVVERRWTSNEKSTLKVKSKDGGTFPSPQSMLDKLVGRLSFDPLSFMRLEKKAQVEALRKLVGIDFRPLDARRGELYQERTVNNRVLEQHRARLKAMPDTPIAEPVDVRALLQQIEQLKDKRRAVAELDTKIGTKKVIRTETGSRLARTRQEIQRLEAEAARLEVEYRKLDEEMQALQMDLDMAPDFNPEITAAEEKLASAEAINAVARQAEDRKKVAATVAEVEKKTEQLTASITEVDDAKAKALAAAKFPVPGLSFTEDGILLNEVPLEQASASEQLRVSVAMGLALNPTLRVLLVRDGSLLDSKSLRMVAELAQAAGAQVWVEVVGKGGVGVVIEDGEVAPP